VKKKLVNRPGRNTGQEKRKMRIRSIRTLLFAFVVMLMSLSAFGQVRISVTFGPPALPVYEQPLCPGDGYIWTPGYWAWSDDDGDYYWVPGTWVSAPEVGYLWTPPYWAWNDGAFVFYDGYWGPHVGFYGGINYGFGYFGDGFEGGRWDSGRFFYNRSVTNVNITNIHNVYNTTVINNTRTVSRVSYNGGNGGLSARPTPEQETAMHERHLPPAAVQTQHIQAARGNPELRASANQGKPPIAATARPGAFSGGAVPAREAGAPYHPPANRPTANRESGQPPVENGGRSPGAFHPRDLPPMDRTPAPNTGNAKTDQKYQQQQQKLQQKQDQERQKLQQQQEKDHQKLAQQNANDARKQQTEQRHQQQTQQLQQRHVQQQQTLQQRQAPPNRPEAKPPKGRPQ
jgi:hypothetical protein